MSIIVNTKKGKVARFLCFNPTNSYTIRELSRQVKISPTWISKIVKEFKKNHLVETKEDSNSLKVKSKRDAPFMRLKQILNLDNLYSSGIVDELVETYHKPDAVILFGSYSRGEDTENSDIDIAVLTDRKQVDDSYAKYEKELKRKLSIKVINSKNITKEFALSLANGIVLYGYLELGL